MIIQEVYIGRIPEIEEIFEEFKKLRHNYWTIRTWSNAKQTAKIEKLIERFFGFSAFSLSIDPSPSPNAFTYPVANSIDVVPHELMETTSKGYRYKREAHVAAISIITKGLFANKAFTDDEAFAVFLHEIGHSFVHRSPMIASQQEIFKTTLLIEILEYTILGILTLNPVLLSAALSGAINSTNFIKLVEANMNKLIAKVPLLRELDITAKWVFSFFGNLINNLLYAVFTLTGVTLALGAYSRFNYEKVTKKQIELTGHGAASYSRSAERLSDDFANMYGFGPQLATALLKMENPDNQGLFMKVTHSFPIIEILFNKSDALFTEVNNALEAHPSSADRILYILEGMKTDLKKDKDLPEKIKKELRSNISKLEKTVDEIKKNEGPIAENRNEYIQSLVILGIKDGSSEDFVERKYTDRDELARFYKERKVRKEAAFKEQCDLDLIMIEEGFDSFFE